MEIGKDCLPELWPDIEPETAAIFKKIANVQLRKLFLTDLFQLLHWIVNEILQFTFVPFVGNINVRLGDRI